MRALFFRALRVAPKNSLKNVFVVEYAAPQECRAHHRASCRAGLSFPKITRESRRRDRRQRLVVEYAPKCQFDLVSLGHPLDPILDGRGPALRAIAHQALPA